MNLYSTARKAVLFALILGLATGCSKEDPANKPVANFSYTGTGTAPATVSFTNTSQNASTYLWDFGDNATSTQQNPAHTYTQGGVYTVTLTATGNGSSHTVTKTVNIGTPTTVKITGVKVISVPLTDPATGGGWDNNSGPDVYYRIESGATVLKQGTPIANVTASSLPLVYSLASSPFQTSTFNTTYSVVLYDEDLSDLPSNPDDFIGGYNISFAAFAQSGYPATVLLQNSTSPIKIELSLQWQ